MFDLAARDAEAFNRRVDLELGMHIGQIELQDELYARFPGLFPGDLSNRLRDRKSDGCQDSLRVMSLLEDGDPFKKAQLRSDLDVPHPLDFEWIFSDLSATELAHDLVGPGVATIACVGTPSIYQALGTVGPAIGRVLADRPGVADSLRALDNSNAVFHFGQLSTTTINADAAVVDSPWYPEHTIHFTATAGFLTKVGGRILSVVPPEFTRPGVQAENAAIVEALDRLGISFVRAHRAAVTYQAPPFEVFTLKSLGLHGVPHQWRRGDMLEFQVKRRVDAASLVPPKSDEFWDEVRFRRSRIKFKGVCDADVPDPSLRSVIDGDVLHSVSRRDPVRSQVTVWTSGNRGFKCASPDVLRTGFEASMEGTDPVAACETRLKQKLSAEQARELDIAIAQLVGHIQDEERNLEWH